jgi:3-phenylpropionate/trans-cinnamate dioxygenase ferredoxin reductase subunit
VRRHLRGGARDLRGRRRRALLGEAQRVEHWTHAVEQANAAAENLLAGPQGAQPFASVPFVWSDQYDRKLQCCGWPRPGDEVRFVQGTPGERRFVALFGRKGRLAGAVAMNRVRELVAWRRRLREGIGFEEAVALAETR